MLLIIVATGNHFLFDAAAGAVVVAAGWLVASRLAAPARPAAGAAPRTARSLDAAFRPVPRQGSLSLQLHPRTTRKDHPAMSPLKHSNNIAARMGRWSANHWKTAVFGWLAFVVASVYIGGAVGTKYLEDNDLAVGEAGTATKIIEAGFPEAADEQGEIVLIQSKTLKADDPAFKAAIEDVAKTLDGVPEGPQARHAARGRSRRPRLGRRPLGDGAVPARRHLRRGRRSTSTRSRPPSTRPRPRTRASSVNQLGSVTHRPRRPTRPSTACSKTAGMVALPLTLVILLFVFGSAVAALDPAAARDHRRLRDDGLIALPSQFIPVDESIAEVILLIGLAVGIDYSLFYLRREREERAAGRSEHAALEAAAATSGRAVLISGITVLIAMAGMFLSGDKTFMSFSIGTMMVVAVAMLGSLTVLPGAARQARRPGREGPHPVPGPAPLARTARAASGARSSTASSAARSSRRSPPAPCSSRWRCRRSR